MGRKFGNSRGGKSFLQRSGKSPAFKRMGSSPAKTTGHGGAKGHKHPEYTEVWDPETREVVETPEATTTTTRQKGVGTTTTPGTVDPYKGEGGYMSDEEWAKFLKTPKGKEYTEKHKGKTTTKPLSREDIDVKTKEKPPKKEERKICHCKTVGADPSTTGQGEARSRISWARYYCGDPLPPECQKGSGKRGTRPISEASNVASTATHPRTTKQVKWPYTRPGQSKTMPMYDSKGKLYPE